MKFQLLLPLTLALTVTLVVVIKSRKFEHDKVDKQNKFELKKLKVNDDVLGDLQKEKITLENKIETGEKEWKALKKDAQLSEQTAQKKKKEVVACQGAVKSLKDGVMALQVDLKNLQGEASKEVDSWFAKLESLRKELEMPSAVCAFLKNGVDSANKMCSSKAEKEMEEKPEAEAPKAEEPKAEAPKPEKPKAEAPKPQKPKAKAPKKGAKGQGL
ncbi:uncharacterized protein LOC130915457 [Corythoichthys intestinalis]|uniref:uncharacterized protein LOC130915457 n=1 Tax=Corythoichthys intestinalis TaxID=161448 RepID=UPI0025A615C0|nr:uncharacterized protein LOC130915457 [Corythoichthys intestinalis]